MIDDDALANYRRACDEYRAEMARPRKAQVARWMLQAACYGFIGGFTAVTVVNWLSP